MSDEFELLSRAVIEGASLSAAALSESELRRLRAELTTAARAGRARPPVERLVAALHRAKELTEHPLPALTEQIAGLLAFVRRSAELRAGPAGRFERAPSRDWTTTLGGGPNARVSSGRGSRDER